MLINLIFRRNTYLRNYSVFCLIALVLLQKHSFLLRYPTFRLKIQPIPTTHPVVIPTCQHQVITLTKTIWKLWQKVCRLVGQCRWRPMVAGSSLITMNGPHHGWIPERDGPVRCLTKRLHLLQIGNLMMILDRCRKVGRNVCILMAVYSLLIIVSVQIIFLCFKALFMFAFFPILHLFSKNAKPAF